jgi:hypothetical protein
MGWPQYVVGFLLLFSLAANINNIHKDDKTYPTNGSMALAVSVELGFTLIWFLLLGTGGFWG